MADTVTIDRGEKATTTAVGRSFCNKVAKVSFLRDPLNRAAFKGNNREGVRGGPIGAGA